MSPVASKHTWIFFPAEFRDETRDIGCRSIVGGGHGDGAVAAEAAGVAPPGNRY